MKCPTCGEVEHQTENPDDQHHCDCIDGMVWRGMSQTLTRVFPCDCECHR